MSNLPSKAERSCYSKKRYSTDDVAKKVARKVLEERGDELRSYVCYECGGFHLTKRQTWVEREPRMTTETPTPVSKPIPVQLPTVFGLFAKIYVGGDWVKNANLGTIPSKEWKADLEKFIASPTFHPLIAERLQKEDVKCDAAVIIVRSGRRNSMVATWAPKKEVNGKV